MSFSEVQSAVYSVMAATVSIQPFRPAFLAAPGKPAIPWRRWLAMFDDYLIAVGFPVPAESATAAVVAAAVQRKAAILRASLGTEGYRLYCTLTTNVREPYDAAVDRLARYFDQPASAIFSRSQFSRCQQRLGESITQYVTNLREMASRCEFPADQISERIRDQFVAWCASDAIRERLLQEPITRSLEDIVQLAVTIERAKAEAALTASLSAPSLDPSVNEIEGQHHRRHRDGTTESATSSVAAGAGLFRCWNCDMDGHRSRDMRCPARGKSCSCCGRRGHFAACCRSAGSPSGDSGRQQRVSGPYRTNHRPSRRRDTAETNQLDDESEDPDAGSDSDSNMDGAVSTVVVCSVGDSGIPDIFKRVDVRIADQQLSLMIDLGSKVSIISQQFYNQFLAANFQLLVSEVTLRTYGGKQEIPCVGCVVLPVQFGDRPAFDFRFYVTVQGESMMGVDLFDVLGGTLSLGGVPVRSSGAVAAPAAGDMTSLKAPARQFTRSTEKRQRAVSFRHNQKASYRDGKERATSTRIQSGDLVRIVRPRRVHQRAAMYSGPFPVDQVAGNTVYLSNGQRWDIRNCVKDTSIRYDRRAQSASNTSYPSTALVGNSDAVEIASGDSTSWFTVERSKKRR